MPRHVANHSFTYCPRCHAHLRPVTAINNGDSEFWLECSNPDCNTYVNTYIPQPYQGDFHEDVHRIKGNFGGFGSGKTTTSRMELEKTLIITPSGTTLIGANVASQYEQTLKREFEADFPLEFVKSYSQQKQYMDFKNGHRIIYRPYDDPDKLRSYNLTAWIILEASEVKDEAFTQLKTRLRNTAATVPETDEHGNVVYINKDGIDVPKIKWDWREGIVESNPAAGWIKNDVLNVAHEIKVYGESHDDYYQDEKEIDPAISVHITTTSANAYLPPDFIPMQIKNKPRWWVDRFIYGSFRYADGLVYPSASKYIVEYFPIPRGWKRIVAFDYGLADSACFLFGAIDEEHSLLYFYKEVYTNDRSVEELAKLYYDAAADIPVGGFICAPLIDPKSGPRRDYAKKTLSDNFLDFGISFMPGAVDRDARIYRLNTYFESGHVKIMKTCPNLIAQLRDLKFKAAPTSTTKPWRDEPEDKNDHAVVCAEWIVMELPKDPGKLMYGAYYNTGVRIDEPAYNPEAELKQREDDWALAALSDVSDATDSRSYFETDYNFGGT